MFLGLKPTTKNPGKMRLRVDGIFYRCSFFVVDLIIRKRLWISVESGNQPRGR